MHIERRISRRPRPRPRSSVSKKQPGCAGHLYQRSSLQNTAAASLRGSSGLPVLEQPLRGACRGQPMPPEAHGAVQHMLEGLWAANYIDSQRLVSMWWSEDHTSAFTCTDQEPISTSRGVCSRLLEHLEQHVEAAAVPPAVNCIRSEQRLVGRSARVHGLPRSSALADGRVERHQRRSQS